MRRAASVLLIVAALVWCSQAVRKAGRPSGNDLAGYLEASRALYAGGDPYRLPDRFPYIYPLFLATVIRPLAAVPQAAASVVWFAIQAACLWCVLIVASRSLPPKGGSHTTGGSVVSANERSVASAFRRRDSAILAAIVIAVFGDVLQNEFLNGQVNLIVLALAAAAVTLGERRPRVAAALLGAAIALKLTPALFLVYFLVERRYRVVAESVVWAGVLILSPWIVVRDRLWVMYEDYLREFILPRTAAIDTRPEAIFFTPYGFWEWVSGASPGRAAIVAAAVVIAGALMAWHGWIRRRADAQGNAAWIYAAAIPLLSPMSEVHHLTMMIPAGVVSAASARRRESRVVMFGSAAFAVLVWIARFDRPGPWYFLSAVCLAISAAVAIGVASARGNGPRNRGAREARAGGRWGCRLRQGYGEPRQSEAEAGAPPQTQ